MSKIKAKAKKHYWSFVTAAQNEFSKQAIHQGLSIKDVIQETKLSDSTVKRFFHNGHASGWKVKPYSWTHGPYATTLFAISDALGYQFKPIRKNGASNGKR